MLLVSYRAVRTGDLGVVTHTLYARIAWTDAAIYTISIPRKTILHDDSFLIGCGE